LKICYFFHFQLIFYSCLSFSFSLFLCRGISSTFVRQFFYSSFHFLSADRVCPISTQKMRANINMKMKFDGQIIISSAALRLATFFFYLSLTRVFNFFSLSLSRKKDKSTTHNWRTIETSAFFFRLCLGQAAAQAYEIFYRGLVSSGKTNLPVSFEGLSLKRSQCEFGLLYRVQHPGRHSSRLQMIWRLTSGFSRNFAAALTLVG
jgi:hypothetical protein